MNADFEFGPLEVRFGLEFCDLLEEVRLFSEGNEYLLSHATRFTATILLLREVVQDGMRILELGGSGLLHRFINANVQCWDYTSFPEGRMTDPVVYKEDIFVGNTGHSIPSNKIVINFENSEFPVEADSYDLVICCEVIEHMEIDPMFLIEQIGKITADSGLLFVTTPNGTSSRIVYKAIKGIQPSFYMQYTKDRSLYRHNFEYSVELLKLLVESGGFSVQSLETMDTFEPYFAEGIAMLERLGESTKDRGDNIFLYAKKIGAIRQRFPLGIYA